MKQRRSGILLHITCLPSPYGIGDLGPWAYRFADFLAETKQGYWQILPLNPTCTACGNSPYDSYSAFAGNPLLISPDLLLEDGLLVQEDVSQLPPFSKGRVDYKTVTRHKVHLLERAYQKYESRLSSDSEFERFCHENSEWLEDYALFIALKVHLSGANWSDWPHEVRNRSEGTLNEWEKKLEKQIVREKFVQYLFSKQWTALKRYCNSKNILVIGDLPIYVNRESADVWANPRFFKLDEEKRPIVVGGVPPDYFSATGQLWSNPVYNWDVLKAARYGWWLSRMRHNLSFFDVVRLDHFRGFVACWEVPSGEATAVNGRWVQGPGAEFFAVLLEQFPRLTIFAEDLGTITPDVRAVMDQFGFPGMKILLFAFGDDPGDHPYAPHNYSRNSVVYTGTHDNNTVVGWFRDEATRAEKGRLCAYLGRDLTEELAHWELVRLALMSVANTAIIPMQDLLGLGAEARMNRPGTTKGNWEWRLVAEQITPSLITRVAEMTKLYGRAATLQIAGTGE
jgi:4-alpha-glucanotransferase